jgi:acyl carrier protein
MRMNNPTQIESQLITIVAKSLQIPEVSVKMDSTLMNELNAESIDILDIKFAIEQQFRFKFDNEEIKTMLKKAASEHQLTERDIPELFTVRRLYDYIILKLEQKNATAL